MNPTKANLLIQFFIVIRNKGISIAEECIRYFQHGHILLTILLIFCSIIIIIVFFLLVLIIVYGIYMLLRRISIIVQTKEVKCKPVIAKVIDKEYEDVYGVFLPATRTYMNYPEEYNIYVEYDGVTEVFDSEELFNKYEKGSTIALILVEKLDKNGRPIERTLELPE